MQLTKKQQDFEYVISILKDAPDGLTTEEVHRIYTQKYLLKRDIATIRNRIKELAGGAIDLVTCQYSSKRHAKQFLQDNRPESLKSVISEAQLVQTEREYLEVAMKMVKDLNNFSANHYDLIEEKLKFKKEDSIYYTESHKLESMCRLDNDLLEIKLSIDNDNLMEFIYTAKSSQDYYTVEPYRLILIDGLWYLFGKDLNEKETSPFKTWRIQYIKEVARTNKHYRLSNKEIDDLLSGIYSADFIVGGEEEITVKIYPDIIEEFNFSIHLPGFQKDSRIQHKDGSISVTALVTNYLDIEQDIKKWLPYIEIVAPQEHRDKLTKDLVQYIKQLKG